MILVLTERRVFVNINKATSTDTNTNINRCNRTALAFGHINVASLYVYLIPGKCYQVRVRTWYLFEQLQRMMGMNRLGNTRGCSSILACGICMIADEEAETPTHTPPN